MTIIEPSAELWHQSSPQELIARAARVCYASKGGKRTPDQMCSMLWNSGHRSMFRHGTKYYLINNEERQGLPTDTQDLIGHAILSPFCACVTFDSYIALAANLQYIEEHTDFRDSMKDYEMDYPDILRIAYNRGYYINSIERSTICLITQISTSRELNRTSPNNIAEQSTRYVNFGKRGGIAICRPHWYTKAGRVKKFLTRCYWHLCEFAYNTALRFGLPPEDAREFLPLCAATKVVYTYTRSEWNHILDLRLHGTTGTPHPNAREAARLINNAINQTH